MDKLKYIKLEQEDGSYSDSIPLAVDSNHVDVNGNTLTNELNSKVSRSELNSNISNLQNQILNLSSGSPKGTYTTTTDLINANPDSGVYIVTTDGHLYSWTKNNNSIIDLGIYQSTGIAEKSVSRDKISSGLDYYLKSVDSVYNVLPHKDEIKIKTFTGTFKYPFISQTWHGFGIAINNPYLIFKVIAPIYLDGDGSGTVICEICDDSGINVLYSKEIYITSSSSDPTVMSEFDFEGVNIEDKYPYIFIRFRSTCENILSRVEQYTLDSSYIPMIDKPIICMNNNGTWFFQTIENYIFGLPIILTEKKLIQQQKNNVHLENLDYILTDYVNSIDEIVNYLPYNKNITLSTYESISSSYTTPSPTWQGFGVAINNPGFINKIGASINIGGTGKVRCSLKRYDNFEELAYVDIDIQENNDNPYNMSEFNFHNLDTSNFPSYFYVTFISLTEGKILVKVANYILNTEAIADVVEPFVGYTTLGNEWSKLNIDNYLYGLPIVLYNTTLPEKNDIECFSVPTIYKIQNNDDINKTLPTTLYLDSILTQKQDCYTENETDKIYLKCENSSVLTNDIYTSIENHYLYKDMYNKKLLLIPTKTIKTSSLANKNAIVLQIGDSVTYGAGSQFNTDEKPNTSWGYMTWLGKKYLNSYEQIGNSCQETITLTDNTQYVAKAEGHGGWKLSDYLYIENVNINDTSISNPFYDGNKIWNKEVLNSAGVKFSLNKYLTDKELRTPTHIIIQLGFNDSANSNFITNMEYIILAIKEEYPNMIIGLSLVRDYGTWYEKYYPSLINNNSGKHSTLNIKLREWITDYMKLEDITNNIYFIPNYFVTPTGDSIPTYEINDKKVAFRNDDGYHPNHKAHIEWGLQQFAWLAYTLLK